MSQLLDFAKRELDKQQLLSPESDYNGELGKAVLSLLEAFSGQGHSGASAAMCLNLFKRLSQFKPLTPLTNNDDEWMHVSNGLWQNKRCSSVFMEDGVIYDIGAIVFVERETGATFTSKESRKVITLPYTVPDSPEYLYYDTREPVDALTLDKYQELAATTAIYPGQGTVNGLMYVSLGGAGEMGEFCDQVKRVLRDDNGVITPQRKAKMLKELGDEMWYLAGKARELGVTLSSVAQANLDKLFDRQNRGVLHGEGNNR